MSASSPPCRHEAIEAVYGIRYEVPKGRESHYRVAELSKERPSETTTEPTQEPKTTSNPAQDQGSEMSKEEQAVPEEQKPTEEQTATEEQKPTEEQTSPEEQKPTEEADKDDIGKVAERIVEQNKITAAIRTLEEAFGKKVVLETDPSSITSPAVQKAFREGYTVKAWIDVDDRSVHAFLPMIDDASDAVKTYVHEVIGADQSGYLVLDQAGRQKMLPSYQVVDAIHYTPQERKKSQKAYDEATEGLHPKEEVLTESQKRAAAYLSATEQQQSPIYRATHPEIAEEELSSPVALAGAKQALADVLEGQNEEVKTRVDQMAIVLRDGEADPTEELTKLFIDESLSDNDRQSILDVVTAQSRLTALEQSHKEEMAQMQRELTKEWSARSVVGDETARGAVISATIADADGKPKEVYVTGGVRVVMNEGGTVELLPTDDDAPIYVYDESVDGEGKGHIVQMDDLSSPQLVAEDYLDVVQASLDEAETAFRSEVRSADWEATKQKYGVKLSEEVDENGKNFVLNSEGEKRFGQIPEGLEIPAGDILLSEGDRSDDGGENYGLKHIEDRHGNEIRANGFRSVVDFVEYVASHYNRIKRGTNGAGDPNGTYLLQLTDEHNNTVYIELSQDGTYWRVNSAGVFHKGYGNNKETIRPASAVQGETPQSHHTLPTPNDNSGYSEDANGTVYESSLRQGKGTEKSEGEQFLSSLPRTREGEVDGLKLMSERPDDFIRYLGQLYGEDFVASLPLSKSGALDLKALTPEQTLRVNEAALGETDALAAARQTRSALVTKRNKLQTEVQSDLSNLEKRMQLRQVQSELAVYDEYVTAKDKAIKEAKAEAERQAKAEAEQKEQERWNSLTPEEQLAEKEEGVTGALNRDYDLVGANDTGAKAQSMMTTEYPTDTKPGAVEAVYGIRYEVPEGRESHYRVDELSKERPSETPTEPTREPMTTSNPAQDQGGDMSKEEQTSPEEQTATEEQTSPEEQTPAEEQKPTEEQTATEEQKPSEEQTSPEEQKPTEEADKDDIGKVAERIVEQNKITAAIRTLEEAFGKKVVLETDPSSITSPAVQKAFREGYTVKAWIDVDDRSVHVFLPMIDDASDAVKTYVHEVIGHFGARELLGEEGYNTFLDKIAETLGEEEVQKAIAEWAQEGQSPLAARREAMDEWVAHRAEEKDAFAKKTVWQTVKDFVQGLFGKLPEKTANEVATEMTDALLKESADNLRKRHPQENTSSTTNQKRTSRPSQQKRSKKGATKVWSKTRLTHSRLTGNKRATIFSSIAKQAVKKTKAFGDRKHFITTVNRDKANGVEWYSDGFVAFFRPLTDKNSTPECISVITGEEVVPKKVPNPAVLLLPQLEEPADPNRTVHAVPIKTLYADVGARMDNSTSGRVLVDVGKRIRTQRKSVDDNFYMLLEGDVLLRVLKTGYALGAETVSIDVVKSSGSLYSYRLDFGEWKALIAPTEIGKDALKNYTNFKISDAILSSRTKGEESQKGGARQKMNAKQAKDGKQDVVTDGDVRFRATKRGRETIEGWLSKRPDLTEEDKATFFEEIEDLDNKGSLAAGRWFANGRIRLPEDMPKVEQALKVAEIAKVDPLQYESPMDLVLQHAEIELKEKPIDPETIPTLHRAKAFDNGLVIYDVDDTMESRENMRRIINTHFGKEASPWCLLQGDGEGNLTEESQADWDYYNAYPKQVAFVDGKLTAFSANSSGEVVWWDRMDRSSFSVPVGTRKVEGDRMGRSGEALFNTETGSITYRDLFLGNKTNGSYEEWHDNDVLKLKGSFKDGRKNGTFEEWDSEGRLWSRISYKDGNRDGLLERWWPNGEQSVRAHYKMGKKDGLSTEWFDNGQKKSERHYVNGELNGVAYRWLYDGSMAEKRNLKNGLPDGPQDRWSRNGDHTRYTFEEGVQHGLQEMWDAKGNLVDRYLWENGRRKSRLIAEDSDIRFRRERQDHMNAKQTKRGDMNVVTQADIDEAIRFRSNRSAADFARLRDSAIEKKGLVAPDLNQSSVKVTPVRRHNFTGTGLQAIEKARVWAKHRIVKDHWYHKGKSDGFKYLIDEDGIGKFLSGSSTKNSDNLGLHLAILKKLPRIIDESILAETHADYRKVDGKRSPENGVDKLTMLVHRLYGAVKMNGELYRVKTTLHERYNADDRAYDYMVTSVELVISGSSTSDALTNSTRKSLKDIAVAKLLKGVEKSYDPGKLLLDESESAGSEEKISRFRRAERDGDVSTAAQVASDFYRSATPQNTSLDEMIRFARVYHNSPYLLKKADGAFVDPDTGERLGFDHRFMGSGEGHQAHGWGSYFSVKDLAGYARDKTSFDPMVSLDEGVNEEQKIRPEDYAKYSEEERRWADHVLDVIHLWYDEGINDWAGRDPLYAIDVARDAFMEACGYPDRKTAEARWSDFVDFYENTLMQDIYGPRHKYAVEVPDDTGANYLEEVGRITPEMADQIDKQLQEAAAEEYDDVDGRSLYDLFTEQHPKWRERTGGELYDGLLGILLDEYTDDKVEAKQWASELLNEAGIVGIHYNGRQDGECYVIFNENDAKIVDHIRFKRERQDIEERAKKDGTWMTAPDGSPSLLSEAE